MSRNLTTRVAQAEIPRWNCCRSSVVIGGRRIRVKQYSLATMKTHAEEGRREHMTSASRDTKGHVRYYYVLILGTR